MCARVGGLSVSLPDMVLRIAGAQLNLVVGDLEGNCRRIGDAMDWAEENRADLLVLPELAVSGYPPEDLALRGDFLEANREVLARLASRSRRTVTVVGFLDSPRSQTEPPPGDDTYSARVANAAAILRERPCPGDLSQGALAQLRGFRRAALVLSRSQSGPHLGGRRHCGGGLHLRGPLDG